jgi:hypothetical protein
MQVYSFMYSTSYVCVSGNRLSESHLTHTSIANDACYHQTATEDLLKRTTPSSRGTSELIIRTSCSKVIRRTKQYEQHSHSFLQISYLRIIPFYHYISGFLYSTFA